MLTGHIAKQGNLPDMPVIGYKAGEEIQATVNVATGYMTAEVKCMQIGANHLALGADFVYSSAMTENIVYGTTRTFCAPGWKLNLQQYLLPAAQGETVTFGDETLDVDYIYVDPAGNKHYIVDGADCSGLGLTLSEADGRKRLTDMQGDVLEFFGGKLVKVRRMTGYEENSSTMAFTDVFYSYDGDRLKSVSVEGTGAGRTVWVIYDGNNRISKLYCDGNKHQIVPEYAETGEMTGIYRARGTKRERICELASCNVSSQAEKKLRRIVAETAKALQFTVNDAGTVTRVAEGGYTPDNAGVSINEKRADLYTWQNKYQTDILNEKKGVTLHYSFDDDGFLVSILESSAQFPNHLTSLMPVKKANSGFSFLGDKGTVQQFNGHDVYELTGFEDAEDIMPVANLKTDEKIDRYYNFQKNITEEIRNGFYNWNTLPGINTTDNLFVFSAWVNNELCRKACIKLQTDQVQTIFLKIDTVKKGWQFIQKVCAFPKCNITGVKLFVFKEKDETLKIADLKFCRLPTSVPEINNQVLTNEISTVNYYKNGNTHSIKALFTQKDVELTLRSKYSNYGGIGNFYDLFLNNGKIHINKTSNISYTSSKHVFPIYKIIYPDHSFTTPEKPPENIANKYEILYEDQKVIDLFDNRKTRDFYENLNTELFFGAVTKGIDNKRIDYDFIVYLDENGKTIARNYKTAKLGNQTSETYTDLDMLGNVLTECDQYGVLKKNKYDRYGNVIETVLIHKDDPEDTVDKIVQQTIFTGNGEYPTATYPITQPLDYNPYNANNVQFEKLSGCQTATENRDHKIFYTYDSFYRKTASVVYADAAGKYITGNYYNYDKNGRIERVTANKKDGYKLNYDKYGNFCGVDRTNIISNGLYTGQAYCGDAITSDSEYIDETIYSCNYEFFGKSIESYGIGSPEFTTNYNQNSEIFEHFMKENGQTTRLLRNVYRDDVDKSKALSSSATKLRESYDYAQNVMYEYGFDEYDNVCNYGMYRLLDNDQKGELLTSVKNTTYDKNNKDENATVYTYHNPVSDEKQSVVYDKSVLIAPRIDSVYNSKNFTYYFYDKLGRLSRIVNHHGMLNSTWFYVAHDYFYKNVSSNGSVQSTTALVQDINVTLWYGNMVNPPVNKKYHYEYTWDGRLQSETKQNLDEEDTSAKTIQYTYDALGRIIQIDDLATGQILNYYYDSEGNVISKRSSGTSLSSTQFTYDGDQLLNVTQSGETAKYFAYDRYGNPTHYGVAESKLSGAANMSFTRVNLLSSYNGNNYFYDAGGKLYKLTTSDGWTKEFFYDCDKLTSEIWTNQNGKTITTQYGYNASGVCNLTIKNTDNKTKCFYYEKDGDGSITGIFEWQNDKFIRYVAKYKYDANGNCTIDHALNGKEVYNVGDKYELFYDNALCALPGNINPFRWKGMRYEHNSKFYYYFNRFYDSTLMRWVTPDSPKTVPDNMAIAFGFNRYIFAGNNPLALDAPVETCLPGIDLMPETREYNWWDYNGWWVMIVIGVILIIAAAAVGGPVAAAGACSGTSMSVAGMAAVAAIQAIKMALVSALIGAATGFIGGMLSSYANGATDDLLDNALNGALQGACMGFMTGALTAFVGQVAKVVYTPKTCCFIAGTLVKTRDGDKKIEEIEVGDEVLSYDEETRKSDWKKVVQLFRNTTESWCTVRVRATGTEDGAGDFIDANFDDGYPPLCAITSTPGHKYYVPQNTEIREIGEKNEHASYNGLSVQWVSAVHLRPGDKVLLSDGKYGIVQNVKLKKLDKPETTYNFEVEDNHTYFVGESGVCVHNTCDGKAFTKDQQAVIDLAKDAKKAGGINRADANTLVSWAKEYGLNSHFPRAHIGRAGIWGTTEHINILRIHIPIIG